MHEHIGFFSYLPINYYFVLVTAFDGQFSIWFKLKSKMDKKESKLTLEFEFIWNRVKCVNATQLIDDKCEIGWKKYCVCAQLAIFNEILFLYFNNFNLIAFNQMSERAAYNIFIYYIAFDSFF